MKLDDIVLLGFVDEALKYLKNEVKENERPEIEKLVSQLDIERMKNDLNEKFGSSFIGANEVIKALMKSGNDAFNDYTEKKKQEAKALDEINELFDSSFLQDGETKEVKLPKPNLGNLEMEEKPQIDVLGFINELKEKLVNVVKEEFKEEAKEEPRDLKIKEEDVNIADLKDTLKEIIEGEAKLDEEEQEELPFIEDDDEVYNAIRKAADQNENFEEEIQTLISDNGPEVKYDEEVLNKIIDDVNEESHEEENMYSSEHHNAYVNNLIDDLQKKMDKGLFESASPEDAGVKVEEKEEYTPEVHNQYVTNLMKDLQKQIEIEEARRKELEEAEKVYKEINDVYPNLPRKFVHVVYDAKNDIVDGLLHDERIILLHRVRFEELDNLRQYAEILLTHDFNVNVDEHQMIVDAMKVINNIDGKIVTNIFEVANQAYLLGGVYDGYRVIKEDDVNL